MTASNNSNNSNLVNKDTALRALLFAMLFYILSSPLIAVAVNKVAPFHIEVQLVNAIIFGILFYIISVNI